MSQKIAYCPDIIWTDNQQFVAHALVVSNGLIEALLPVSILNKESTEIVNLPNMAIIPGMVNTHTHSFQSLLKGVADDQDFFMWRDKALYKYSNVMTSEELYVGALFAFSEMLLNGVTTACDFFYINAQSNENARHIIRAAEDLGIRFVLARTFYDWDGAPEVYRETIDQALTNTTALMTEYEANPMVSILPAPHSLHGASPDLIKAAAECAKLTDVPCHMHIAEGQYERGMMIEKYGKTPIQVLADWGVMNERLVGIHCVWIDDADIQLMAERGMTVSYNPSSNMFLGDGITPIRRLLDADITIALGTDGGCSNNRASIIDEMRQAALLQKVSHCDATIMTAEDVLNMGTRNAEVILGQPLGQLKAGYPADFAVLNLNDLSLQPREFWTKQWVYAMQPSAIQQVYVAGRCVVKAGQLLGMEKELVVEKVQQVWARWKNL